MFSQSPRGCHQIASLVQPIQNLKDINFTIIENLEPLANIHIFEKLETLLLLIITKNYQLTIIFCPLTNHSSWGCKLVFNDSVNI